MTIKTPAMRALWSYGLAALTVALAACGGGGGGSGGPPPVHIGGGPTPTPSPVPPPTPTPTPAATPPSPPPNTGLIKHVVIIVQENRSFDNLFLGFPGADTSSSGLDSQNQLIQLHSWRLGGVGDISHDRADFNVEYNGGAMNGFDQVGVFGETAPDFAYAYVFRNDVQTYWNLANTYTLADRMFSSASAGSYPQHQFLISGQSYDVVEGPDNLPWGCDAPPGTYTGIAASDGEIVQGPFPCFPAHGPQWPARYTTLATLLDQKQLDWRYYAPAITSNDYGGQLWSAFDSVDAVRHGPDWAKVSSPETNVLHDISSGSLKSVSWVMPSFANSDHPGNDSATGPDWVGSIVNAVATSPQWKSTAIFIVWDDWGGWYDHVPPPQLDHIGLGFRVPLIVVSPFAKHGYVSHVQYEFGSIVNFVEWAFNLPSLHVTDARANNLFDCFNFSSSPARTRFRRLPLRHSVRQFLTAPPDHRIPDND